MWRIFGKKKEEKPAPTLDDASKNLETRTTAAEEKVKKLDDELLKYKQQLAKMKPGPAKTNLQKRAMSVLKQKKMYEKQTDVMRTQQFNIDQTKFAQDNMKDTATTVAAMKAAGAELKQQFKGLNIDEIEDLHDDMSDLMEMNDEINEVMGRTYGVPEELDEADLMAELDSLETELEQETDEIPSYIINASKTSTSTTTNTNTDKAKDQEKSTITVDMDEFGLPKVPARRLNA